MSDDQLGPQDHLFSPVPSKHKSKACIFSNERGGVPRFDVVAEIQPACSRGHIGYSLHVVRQMVYRGMFGQWGRAARARDRCGGTGLGKIYDFTWCCVVGGV